MRYVVIVSFAACIVMLSIAVNQLQVKNDLMGKVVNKEALPAAPLYDYDGNAIDLKGVRIINFFASWCTPCAAEHPYFMQLKEQHNIRMLGVAWRDDAQKTQKWLKRLGNPFDAVAYDLGGTYGVMLGIRGLPETFVLDEEGRVIYRFAGALNQAILDEEILPRL